MPCTGCQQRREIGHRIVASYRRSDYEGVKDGLSEMGASLGRAVVPRFMPRSPELRMAPPPEVDSEGHKLALRIRPGHEHGGRRGLL